MKRREEMRLQFWIVMGMSACFNLIPDVKNPIAHSLFVWCLGAATLSSWNIWRTTKDEHA